MLDNTPNYLKQAYAKWFEDHPESEAEIKTTTVRQQKQHGDRVTYVKHTPGGDVQITKEEFDARYWARERGTRLGK